MPSKLKTETLILFTILLAATVGISNIVTRNSTISRLEKIAGERLQLYRRTISHALEKYSYLPCLLSKTPRVISLMGNRKKHPPTPVSRFLADVVQKSGAAAIFVMDRSGETIATSNWDSYESYIGQNYAFRPYFKDAIAGKEGQFYAIGATTGRPGYFLSHPIRNSGEITGVLVVKVNLADLQKDWLDGGEIIFVTDGNGVIFLSSKKEWKYKTTVPLTSNALTRIRAGQQYDAAELSMLPMDKGVTGGAEWIRISGEKFLWSSTLLPALKWRLHFLSPWQSIKTRVRTVLFMTSTCAILLVLYLLFLRERRLKEISLQKVRDADKIKEINTKLQLEIEERRRTETELRQTQNELIQAGKLAVIGQMAAAIVHELNQPIAATRMSIASCKVMVSRQQFEELTKTLQWISELNSRMAAMTQQLKNFSRKSPLKMEAINPVESLQKALELLKYLISDADCTIDIFPPVPPENDEKSERLAILNASKPLNPSIVSDPSDALNLGHHPMVHGDALRLEQVFVNVIRNALDAINDQNEKKIEISLTSRNRDVEISITDSGPGISETVLGQLFEPFFTTKAKGDGLGIGLAISQEIMKDMNGTLHARNATSGSRGAIFTITLARHQIN